MIVVIATVRLQPGVRQRYLEELSKIVPLVRGEAGCIEYVPTRHLQTNIPAQPQADENVVTLVEKWESLEALERHLVAPHMVEYRSRVKELVAEVTLHVLEPLGM